VRPHLNPPLIGEETSEKEIMNTETFFFGEGSLPAGRQG
jgi:hypothetical protein